MASVYTLNKGINRPIEFKGLKAQYIGYLAAGLVVLLLLFAGAYLAGLPMLLCLILVFGLGSALFITVYRLSDRYGLYGLLKRAAQRSLPVCIRSKSRHPFTQLLHAHGSTR